MEVNVLNNGSGLASSNPAMISFATDRLKEEHQHLRNQLKMFESHAKEVILIDDTEKGLQILQQLKGELPLFMDDLEQHFAWEKQDLFPFLMSYFNREPVPTIRPSLWVLEKDHQLSVSFIHSFDEAVIDSQSTAVKKQLSEAAAHLVQACLLLNDHFTMEEQVIFPLTEKILLDLESFFS
ncbi:hemerythrin domain-containing protein [Paenibacillus sinopodophylli]|uniref:hemerythrin domain-containing protein n=1 Tax=Paenibacillus sinopodophylli TaxID=1837342 RepID=UPI00110CBF56|nr:hemerythrin domain-containing protein [Paenibacillus sinopodophylli]